LVKPSARAVKQGGSWLRPSPRSLAARDDMLDRFNPHAVAAILSRMMPALSRPNDFSSQQ
jgi:hypothetical protein